MRTLGLLFLLVFSNIAAAADNAGKWFVLWGYNRASYQDSDIAFKGTASNRNPYDFTLHNVQAKDLQSEFQWQWVFPDITVPQTNARIGYYLDETHRVNFGVDHMKYVMIQDQVVNKSGTDFLPSSSPTQNLSSNYLTFEHTDGLNYISVGYEMLHPFYATDLFKFSTVHGPDGGIVMPKTNASVNGVQNRHDDFCIAGFGAAYKIGIITDIGKNWFVQLDLKRGILNMPWIKISNNASDNASQIINFTEGIMTVGYVF